MRLKALSVFTAFHILHTATRLVFYSTSTKKQQILQQSKLNEDSPSLQYSAVVLEIRGLSIYEALRGKYR